MFASARTLLDLFFPRPKEELRLDHLEPHLLARTAVRTTAPLSPPVLAPLPYQHELVQHAVHAAKYHGHARAAELLGKVLAGFLSEELAERRSFGAFHTPILAPVPLHPLREQERGYNQADRIAVALLDEIRDEQLTYAPNLFERLRHTTPQATITSRRQRSENMRYAFSVPEPESIRGKDVIILDDVVTTGATLHTLHDAVRRAGARDILLVAVAH